AGGNVPPRGQGGGHQMSGPNRFTWAGILALVIGGCVDSACAGPCAPETVRTDTSEAQGRVACFFGGSAGQTFLARDSLIRSISVWRIAGETYPPMKLWITRTDTTGVPITCCDILLDGPIVQV